MYKSFLLKTVFLVIALAAVLVVVIAITHPDFSSTATETTQTQTFFEQFVIAGGPIVWFVLLPMSVVMVCLATEHALTIRRKKLLAPGMGQRIVEIIRQFGPGQLVARVGNRGDFVSVAVVKAINQGGSDWRRVQNLLAESLQEQSLVLLRRIEWVNLIGNVSPMVGLFGTVFGMIKLFNAIVMAGGQPQPAQLAEGISVALVTTFWGLLIAIPALAVHGVFRNRIETLAGAAVVEAEILLPEIRRSLREQKQTEQPRRKQPLIKSGFREIGSKPARTVDESLHSR